MIQKFGVIEALQLKWRKLAHFKLDFWAWVLICGVHAHLNILENSCSRAWFPYYQYFESALQLANQIAPATFIFGPPTCTIPVLRLVR